MIVDAHVHYGIWSRGYQPIESLLAEAEAIGIDKIVQVTNSRARDNDDSVAGAQRFPDRVAGIIGVFDPLLPNAEARLVACMARPGMSGVRIISHPPGTERWLRDRTVDPVFAAAEKQAIPVLLYASGQIGEMHDTARRFPGLRLIVDHMGVRPGDTEDVFAQWPALARLGAERNVWIKVSLFPESTAHIETYPFPIAQRQLRRLYEEVGAQKLIWGSNYPVVAGACTYAESLDFIREHCDFLSASDKAAILGGNALGHCR